MPGQWGGYFFGSFKSSLCLSLHYTGPLRLTCVGYINGLLCPLAANGDWILRIPYRWKGGSRVELACLSPCSLPARWLWASQSSPRHFLSTDSGNNSLLLPPQAYRQWRHPIVTSSGVLPVLCPTPHTLPLFITPFEQPICFLLGCWLMQSVNSSI